MACFCQNVMILKDIQQLDFHRWSFFIQVYIQQEKLLLLCPPLRSLVEYFALALYLIIVFIPFYLIKMKALTYTSYREHCKLYAEIHGSTTVNGCQVEHEQRDTILLSKVPIIFYRASKSTGVENNKFIHFNLSAGAYSIDNFNTKIRVAISQQRQDREPPQIKDL